MQSYVYRPNMDKDIENIVKCCKGYDLATKAPPIKYSPWPKMDRPWSRMLIAFAGPLDGYYYLIVIVFRNRSKSLGVEIRLQKLQSISFMNCSPDLG